jgi:hypothetical protein
MCGVEAGAKMLCIDDTQGFLLGSVMERMGGYHRKAIQTILGHGNIASLYLEKKNSLSIYQMFNFPKEYNQHLIQLSAEEFARGAAGKVRKDSTDRKYFWASTGFSGFACCTGVWEPRSVLQFVWPALQYSCPFVIFSNQLQVIYNLHKIDN